MGLEARSVAMSETIATYEMAIRLAAFAGIFALMAAWELIAPRRVLRVGRVPRWPSNLGIVVLDTALVRVLLPMGAVALATVAQSRGWGLFNVWGVPGWVAVLASVIALDLVIYVQHVAFHAVPVLWRFHRMHHADLDIDVTTGARFHPVEIALSLLLKFAVVVALGVPPLAVLVFEVVLNATAMFNHSNARLPLAVDRVLRLMLVTPDMHRVHHSVIAREHNSNFGFNLPWWDRLFGTYRAAPEAGHDGMTIGLLELRDPAEQRLDRMITQPWRRSEKSP
jgi:sterol desaturase/sphingolipid hydroxylase (fatty acid hydroxylase superfamily)